MNRMMVDYLGHSGFLVETESVLMLFDYYKGPLEIAAERADSTGKPLYVFASHAHGDHFNPEIFHLSADDRSVTYVFSFDIKASSAMENLESDRTVPESIKEKIHFLEADTAYDVPGLGRIETLKSTDEGVAFFVTDVDENVIYHAGDLHWWDWEGEDPQWLEDDEKLYKQEIERISGRKIDLAFVVLDDRLEENYAEGMNWFLQRCEPENVFPMHFWEDRTIIHRFFELPDCREMLANKKIKLYNTVDETHWDLG